MKKIIILFLLSHLSVLGQNNYKNLFFAASDDIAVLNFENESPVVIQKGFGLTNFIITHIEDSLNNVISYSDGGAFLDSNDSFIPGSGLTYSPPTEITSCKIPGTENKYYYFYNTGTWGNYILYNILDFNANNGIGEVYGDYYLTTSNFNYSEGLELIRIPNSDNYWLILMELNTSRLVRYKIDENGIGDKEVIYQIDDFSLSMQMQGEIDFHNGKLVFTGCKWNEPYGNEVLVFDFDPNSGEASNMTTFGVLKALGAEFSPNGSKLYVCGQNENWNNLHQIDLITNTVSTSTIPISGAGLQLIEMGPNGKLYISSFTTTINVIDNPNEDNFTTSTIEVASYLRGGISDVIQSDVYPGLALSSVINHPSCTEFSDGNATVTAANGTPPYTYLWNDPQNQTTATVSNLFEGTYTVWVTDSLGIQTIHQVHLQIPNQMQIENSTTNASCYNNENGSIELSISEGNPPYTIWWFGEDSANLGPGEYQYMVVDSLYCTIMDTFFIESPSEINVQAYVQNISCNGADDGFIVLNTSGGITPYTYDWSGPNNFESTNPIVENLNIGTYFITVTDAINCQTISSFTISTDSFLSHENLITNPSPCEQGGLASVEIVNGIPPYLYTWYNNSEIIGTQEILSGISPGNYSLIVLDQNDCSLEIPSIIIDSVGAPICDFIIENNGIFDINQTIEFTNLSYSADSINIYSWFWDFNKAGTSTIENPSFSFPELGQFYVTLNVQDENGCNCFTGKYLTIYDKNLCFIPTVFSPNQDNLNELFQPIISNLNLDKYLLIVFDRWGKETFTSSNYEEYWDGTYKGEVVTSGTYIYKLNYQTNDGSSHTKTGTITLIH